MGRGVRRTERARPRAAGWPTWPARPANRPGSPAPTAPAWTLLTASGPVRATWGADVVAASAGDPVTAPTTGDFVRPAALGRRPDHRRGGPAAAYGDRPSQRVRAVRGPGPGRQRRRRRGRRVPRPGAAGGPDRAPARLGLGQRRGAGPRPDQGRSVLGRPRGRSRARRPGRPGSHGARRVGRDRRRAGSAGRAAAPTDAPWPSSAAPERASPRCSTPWSGPS